MRTTQLLAALAPLVGLVPLPAAGQATIRGIVLDARTEKPVIGATVALASSGQVAVTQNEGAFFLPVGGAGRFVVQTTHVAYAARSDTIQLGDGRNAVVQILLVETAIELPPITVETHSTRLEDAGFFSRRTRGGGIFMTREDIAEQKARHVADVFARVPGLRRAQGADGNSHVDSRGGRMITRPCQLQYFIDGVRSELGTGIDGIPIEIVEGIEIYRGGSEVPMQFDAGTAACGAVVLWTRRG